MDEDQRSSHSKSNSEGPTSALTADQVDHYREMEFRQLMMPTLVEIQRQYNRLAEDMVKACKIPQLDKEQCQVRHVPTAEALTFKSSNPNLSKSKPSQDTNR